MQNFLSLWLNAGAQITHGGQAQRPRQKKFKRLDSWANEIHNPLPLGANKRLGLLLKSSTYEVQTPLLLPFVRLVVETF